jgi:LPPG:FO 2-phospho-L-lactate transferase
LNVVELSGGVGGARLARGLDQIPGLDLTIVVNVGDDDDIHSLRVSADLDTVIYTLAGVEGAEGWGRRDDTFTTNTEMGALGADNTFRLGDLDLAMNILRTDALARGISLAEFTSQAAAALGVRARVLPASNDRIATIVVTSEGERLAFQEYFVIRRHRDTVERLEYQGATEAAPSPGAIEAIGEADLVVIGPSNPPLSIWPILAIPGYRDALEAHPKVVAVSPLIGGRALKGPADRVMDSLGLGADNEGVIKAYGEIIDVMVVDESDEADAGTVAGVEVIPASTRIPDAASSLRLARFLVGL